MNVSPGRAQADKSTSASLAWVAAIVRVVALAFIGVNATSPIYLVLGESLGLLNSVCDPWTSLVRLALASQINRAKCQSIFAGRHSKRALSTEHTKLLLVTPLLWFPLSFLVPDGGKNLSSLDPPDNGSLWVNALCPDQEVDFLEWKAHWDLGQAPHCWREDVNVQFYKM